jgi:molybdopterin-guanine dinucleotide biosynthesis protein A
MRARLYPCGGAELPPLHAVYRRTVIAHLKRQLNGGTLRPTFLFEKHAIRVISKETLHDIDPEGLNFYNVNAPEDYQRALQRWEARLMSSQRFSAERIVLTAISLSPGA